MLIYVRAYISYVLSPTAVHLSKKRVRTLSRPQPPPPVRCMYSESASLTRLPLLWLSYVDNKLDYVAIAQQLTRYDGIQRLSTSKPLLYLNRHKFGRDTR